MASESFLRAAKNGDYEVVRSFLMDDRSIMFSREEISNETAVVLAIKNNHISVLQTFIDMQAALFYNRGWYSVYDSCVVFAKIAVRLQNVEVLDMLVQNVENIIAATAHDLARNTGDLNVLEFLTSIYGEEVF
jgi:hypothetical protein